MRLAFEEAGAGEPIVLVHGITEDRQAWREIVPLLADEYRVITVDLRGHGQSSKEPPYDLQTLADDVRSVMPNGAYLVGHSLGGAIVSMVAQFGARAVVNVDQPLRLSDIAPLLRSLESDLRGSNFANVLSMQIDMLGGPSMSRALRDELRAYRSSADQNVVLALWDPLLSGREREVDTLIEDALRKIKAPYLLIHGSEPGADYRRWLEERVPNVSFDVWPDQGHWLHRGDPNRFARRLKEVFRPRLQNH